MVRERNFTKIEKTSIDASTTGGGMVGRHVVSITLENLDKKASTREKVYTKRSGRSVVGANVSNVHTAEGRKL